MGNRVYRVEPILRLFLLRLTYRYWHVECSCMQLPERDSGAGEREESEGGRGGSLHGGAGLEEDKPARLNYC